MVILKYYCQMLRPLNVLLTIISVWLAAFLSPEFRIQWTIGYASLAAAFILGGANILNDIRDLPIDRLNRPLRLLPLGKVKPKQAYGFVFFSFTLGLIFAELAGWWFLRMSIIVVLLLVWYDLHLKRTVLWGNILVSAVAGFTFIYGAMAVADWTAGIIPASFAFFFHFGREILKDMQDVEGDRKQRAWTLPVKYGMVYAKRSIEIIFIILIGLTILPYIFSVYGLTYLIAVIFGVHSILIYVMVKLNRGAKTQNLALLSGLLKVDMFIGLFAVWLGAHHVTFFI